MAVTNGGHRFPLDKDTKIFEINSPRDKIKGPYVVVYKELPERWAIVAMNWSENPCLGIRWFWANLGYPNSRGYSTWLVAPIEIARAMIVNRGGLSPQLWKDVEDFLAKKMSGTKLQEKHPPQS